MLVILKGHYEYHPKRATTIVILKRPSNCHLKSAKYNYHLKRATLIVILKGPL